MDLERQVAELTQRVNALEKALAARPAESAAVAQTATPVAVMPPPPQPGTRIQGATPAHAATPHPAVVKPVHEFEWGIETILRWAGVALVSLAAIFFVSTAINRGWIGPELQLLGAAVAGASLLAGALRLAPTRQAWTRALGCGGAIVLAVCAVATHEWLDVAPVGVAAAFTLVATAVSLWVAFETRSELIGTVATIFGLCSPVPMLADYADAAALTWITGFILGASAVGLLKLWPGLRLATSWMGALLLVAFALDETVEGSLQIVGFIGTAVVGAALWLAPSVADRLGRGPTPDSDVTTVPTLNWKAVDYRAVGFVPAWIWATVSGLVGLDQEQHVGIAAIIVAAAFVLFAEAAFGRVPKLVSMSTFLGAFTLLAVGFALYFEGPALMGALAGQAATSYYLARRLDDDLLRFASYLFGGVATFLAAVEVIHAIDRDGFEGFGYVLATGIVLAAWIAAAAMLYGREDNEIPFAVPFVGAWIGTMAWVTAVLLDVPQGVLLISVVWAIMACAGLIVGLARRLPLAKNAALATLAFTLGKLFTVDLAEVDVFWRVGLFLVVGVGLIVLGLKVPSLIGAASRDSSAGAPTPDAEASSPDTNVTTF